MAHLREEDQEEVLKRMERMQLCTEGETGAENVPCRRRYREFSTTAVLCGLFAAPKCRLRRLLQIATGRTWTYVDQEPPRGSRIIGGTEGDWAEGQWEVVAQWPPLEDEGPARPAMVVG